MVFPIGCLSAEFISLLISCGMFFILYLYSLRHIETENILYKIRKILLCSLIFSSIYSFFEIIYIITGFFPAYKVLLLFDYFPFVESDIVPIGVYITQSGNHTIGIGAVDGLFTTGTQNVYLEDKLLGITHDLRLAPYSFTGTVGSNETRFVLKFNNETLSNEDFATNTVMVYTNENININATNQIIKSVRVHDLLGRVLGTFDNVNTNSFSTRNVAKTQSPLLVEVTLENGATKTYKVIF